MGEIRKIEVVAYNSNWPKMYATEAKKLQLALGDNFVSVHHIGSTAVPGLLAKPKIDIIAEVKNGKQAVETLLKEGYEYKGEWNIPFKFGFTKRLGTSVNLHVFEEGHPEVELNLLFRDFLRENSEAREEYAQLKNSLLQDEKSFHKQDGQPFTGYNLGKDAFITKILKNAGFKRHRFLKCSHYKEWEAAEKLRKKYFLKVEEKTEADIRTFTEKNHRHFVLYKGMDIIGYAHVQLSENQRARIHMVQIDEKAEKKSFEHQFVQLIEKYLISNDYVEVEVKPASRDLNFYKSLGYTDRILCNPNKQEKSTKDFGLGKVLNSHSNSCQTGHCQLSFSPLEAKHKSLVLNWLDRPHVREWFHGPGIESTIEGVHRCISGNQTSYNGWIAFCNNEPFAYLMSSRVKQSEIKDPHSRFYKWVETGQKGYTLDLLIGETRFLGRGLAVPMIQSFIQEKLRDADMVFIDPEASNQKAIHIYEWAGFVKLETFIADWHPVPHWLMRLNIEPSSKPDSIKTKRLILRQWKPEDLPLFCALNQDPRVMQYFPSLLTEDKSNALAKKCMQHIDKHGWGLWAVACPGVSNFIGFVGLQEVGFEAPFTPAVEVGWRLAYPYWGKGYATEAAKAAIEFAFFELGFEELVSFTTVQNNRSRRVMEKIGMSRDPQDDFDHPSLDKSHPLSRHVLYRLKRCVKQIE